MTYQTAQRLWKQMLGIPLSLNLLVACSGSSLATCVPPPLPLEPAQVFSLVYPIPGTTNVPVAAGELILSQPPAGKLHLESPQGPVPLGSPVPAASPLPTPFATPSGFVSLFAVPIPTLSAATTYAVTRTYSEFANDPPSCKQTVTSQLGSFTTQ